MIKICTKCNKEKEIKDFRTCRYKDGTPYLKAYCFDCGREYGRKNYDRNKEKVNENTRKFFIANPDYHKNWHIENKQRLNRKYSNRIKNDPAFKLRKNLSRAINYGLAGKKNNQSMLDFLAYTIEELKKHLEDLFEPWMTWQNHGIYDPKTWDDNNSDTWTWQIDHIIPQSILLFSSMVDGNFKKCWALENLRPLSSKQNCTERDDRKERK